MTAANETYDVFVSYSRADGRHAADIDSFLRAKGLKSFFDRRNLDAGLPWVRALEKAIGAAKAAIVLIGPSGFGNTQQYERELAIIRQTGEPDFRVIPVILPETVRELPFDFLQNLTRIDFSHVAKVSDAPDELHRLLKAVWGDPTAGEEVRGAICPYRGLDAFREEDSALFFGRGSVNDPESPIGQLVRKVREHPFVMVVGRSGIGKSSLIFAGLVPALRREQDRFWTVLSFRPGPEPLEALVEAFNPKAPEEDAFAYGRRIKADLENLRAGGPDLLRTVIRQRLQTVDGQPDRLLLHVDQWEELYAQSAATTTPEQSKHRRDDAKRFVELLLYAAQSPSVAVVGTVRADFYDPLIRDLGSILPTQQVTLTGMPRTELKRTIAEPARMAGLSFDPPGLVEKILEDVGEDEGRLPLLQYALKESWALRKGNTITAGSYARSGGVREAIRLTAERTFDSLSARDQAAARQLFLRLVTPGEGQEDTRATAAMPSELAQRRIVDQFAGPRTRLLVTGWDRTRRPTVEFAHEALIRTWPRLQGWIDANREKLRSRAAILRAKTDWENSGGRTDMLLRPGLQLERARALMGDPGEITIDDVADFITESQAADDSRRAADAERDQRRQRAELEATKARLESAERDRQRQDAELEAAQARAQAAGEREAAQKQIAEQARQMTRRTAAALIAALALAISAGAAGLFALDARNKADRQRELAVFSVDAMRRIVGPVSGQLLKLAESTTAAIDSDSPIEQVRAYIDFANYHLAANDPQRAESTLQKINDQIDRARQGGVSRETLLSLLEQRDELEGDIGSKDERHFPTARRAYASALKMLSDNNVEISDTNDIKIRLLRKSASVELFYGDLFSGDLAKAKSLLSQARSLTNDKTRSIELALLSATEAELAIRISEWDTADEKFAHSLELFDKLINSEPSNTNLSLQLGRTLQRYGDLRRWTKRSDAPSAYNLYTLAQKYLEIVRADDVTSASALKGLDFARRGIRLLGLSSDADRATATRRGEITNAIDAAFGQGIGEFRFGMTPAEINQKLIKPVSVDKLSGGAEFESLRYIYKELSEETSIRPFDFVDSCLQRIGYVVFLFHERALYKILFRFLPNRTDCPARKTIVDDFSRRFGLIATGSVEERRVRHDGSAVSVTITSDSSAVTLEFTQR
jgi:TIR domain